MRRGVLLLSLSTLLAIGCGPQVETPLPGGASGTDSSGESPAPASTSSTGSDAASTTTGAGSESTGGSSGADSTGEVVSCDAEGAQPLYLGGAFLLPPADTEGPFDIEGEFDCAVDDVEENTNLWTALLQCDGRGELRLQVDEEHGMFDPTWIGRSIVLTADQSTGFLGGGWFVVRDEQGELLLAAGSRLPPPEVTAPFTVEWVDLGEACGRPDGCLIIYSHWVAFTSSTDGTLHCSEGRGHVTDTYRLEGSVVQTHNPDPRPFGDCPLVQDGGRFAEDFLIVRRTDI